MDSSYRIPLFSVSVLLLCSALVVPAFAQDFSKKGNHTTKKYSTNAAPLPYQWNVDITYPTDDKDGPFPLIFMFNGMECQAAWYTDTVEHVASWGYVIVQYTTGILYPLQFGDREEVQVLKPLLEWLENDCPIKNKINFSRKAVMGHSRGGKLASLHYATRSDLETAVLLDPVDCSSQTLGPKYPSAIAKLAGEDINCGDPITSRGRFKKPAAVIGSGIKSSCTPDKNNATAFSATLSEKSWYISVTKAGHMTFAAPATIWDQGSYFMYDRVLCGHGYMRNEDVISEAKTMAVAWFESQFHANQSSTEKGLEAYMQHLKLQSSKGVLTYEVPELPAALKAPAAEAVTSSATGAGAEKSEL